jgi:hypothetical protein
MSLLDRNQMTDEEFARWISGCDPVTGQSTHPPPGSHAESETTDRVINETLRTENAILRHRVTELEEAIMAIDSPGYDGRYSAIVQSARRNQRT